MKSSLIELILAICFLIVFYNYYPNSKLERKLKKLVDAQIVSDSTKTKPTTNDLTIVWDENSHPMVELKEYSTIMVDSIRNDSVYVHIVD